MNTRGANRVADRSAADASLLWIGGRPVIRSSPLSNFKQNPGQLQTFMQRRRTMGETRLASLTQRPALHRIVSSFHFISPRFSEMK